MGWSWSGHLMYGIIFDRSDVVDSEGEYVIDWDDCQRYEVDFHSSGELGHESCLAIDESCAHVRCGGFELVRPNEMTVGADWDGRLRMACLASELEYSQPHWYLMCKMS